MCSVLHHKMTHQVVLPLLKYFSLPPALEMSPILSYHYFFLRARVVRTGPPFVRAWSEQTLPLSVQNLPLSVQNLHCPYKISFSLVFFARARQNRTEAYILLKNERVMCSC